MNAKSLNFVFFKPPGADNISFPIINVISMITARYYNRELEINLHTDCADEIRKIVPGGQKTFDSINVNVLEVKPYEKVGDRDLSFIMHRCDFYKLMTLYNNGGLWLDLDTVTCSSFDSAFNFDYAFAKDFNYAPKFESRLCISYLHIKDKQFLETWIDGYHKYYEASTRKYGSNYDYLSAKYPWTHLEPIIKNRNLVEGVDYQVMYTPGFGLETKEYETSKIRHNLHKQLVLKDNVDLGALGCNHIHLCSYAFKKLWTQPLAFYAQEFDNTFSRYVAPAVKWFIEINNARLQRAKFSLTFKTGKIDSLLYNIERIC